MTVAKANTNMRVLEQWQPGDATRRDVGLRRRSQTRLHVAEKWIARAVRYERPGFRRVCCSHHCAIGTIPADEIRELYHERWNSNSHTMRSRPRC